MGLVNVLAWRGRLDHPGTRRWLVCLEAKPRVTEDGIEILPYRLFAERAWRE